MNVPTELTRVGHSVEQLDFYVIDVSESPLQVGSYVVIDNSPTVNVSQSEGACPALPVS